MNLSVKFGEKFNGNYQKSLRKVVHFMKKSVKKQIVVIWLIACMICGSITAYAAYTSLGVSLVRQAKSQWCWAACLEMSSRYLGYTDYDQWDIVKEVKGTSSEPYPNKAGTASDYKAGMDFATNGNYTATRSDGTISISSMNSYMDDQVPLIIAIGSYSGGVRKTGHANVVFAVDEANNRFKTKDPAKDNDVIFNYSTITSTSQSQRWDATIKIN